MLLTHAQKNRDIRLRHNVPLAEACILVLILDDLCHVVAENLPDGVFCADQLHCRSPPAHFRFPDIVASGRMRFQIARPALSDFVAASQDILDGE